jgi:hypothetical protein
MGPLSRVVSGGQTGVDRAALDVSLEVGLPCGGWCPRGRRADDGPIDPRYPLDETPSADYRQRTEWNVRDSDGTLVLADGPLEGGSALTVELARRYGRPCLIMDLNTHPRPEEVLAWATGHGLGKLNVAGPRESERPGIADAAAAFLRTVFKAATG